ncbi:MAG: ABC transporter permease [Geminicoccaceae bacterium]|nr:ABC transporter permease [Geminicoccaceae bacterium]MCX7630664.1 ABC transporter permease [Geminicoccaceae bacterium]MDW8123719.1 ABC transporter permease [Geminicoccaceae bacterium]
MSPGLALARRRLAQAPAVLAIVITGGFLLLEAAPGDAVDAYVASLGGDAGFVRELRERWGLDRSVWTRFLLYLAGLVTGDLGVSLAFDRPVAELVLERLPITLALAAAATSLALLLGAGLGLLCGSRPGGLADRLASAFVLALNATPSFWLGIVLVLVFAVRLRWLPSAGIETIGAGYAGVARLLDVARHMVLPVLTLGLVYAALYARVLRAGMVEAWRSDFVRAARAKGLPRKRLVLAHVARNALVPLLTVLGLHGAAMVGGSVVVESLFAVPGLGRLAFEAVIARDHALLVGIVLVCALLVILLNLVVDLLYGRLDPRIELASERR